jgi:hypothetical protein
LLKLFDRNLGRRPKGTSTLRCLDYKSQSFQPGLKILDGPMVVPASYQFHGFSLAGREQRVHFLGRCFQPVAGGREAPQGGY